MGRVERTKEIMAFYKRDEDVDGVPKFTTYPKLPDHIYIRSIERRGCDAILWRFYKLLRAIYVPWFYFMPSCFFFGQYLFPFFMAK